MTKSDRPYRGMKLRTKAVTGEIATSELEHLTPKPPTPGREWRLQSADPVFDVLFNDWHERSGARSALPDAPVVLDRPRRQLSLQRPVLWSASLLALWRRVARGAATPRGRSASCGCPEAPVRLS